MLGRVGRYELLEELARGGMGVVYRARDPEGREVALKLLLEPGDEEETERFLREAEAARRVRHPNVVPVHEVGRQGLRPFLVMDLVRGESLQQRLLREGPLPAAEAARIVAAVARAVAAAHAAGVLHRDLKPANVLLERGRAAPEVEQLDRPLLTDFGVARLQGSRLTRTGELLGTPAYMAPEQARGERGAQGVAIDVYGLGATLYALLTGRPPYLGTSAVQLLAQVAGDGAPPAPRALRPELDPALEALCLRCLAPAPEARFPDALAVAEALAAWTEAGSSPGQPAPAAGPGRWLALLVLALAATLLALGGRPARPTPPRPGPAPQGPAPQVPAPQGPAPQGPAPQGPALQGPAPSGPRPGASASAPEDPAAEAHARAERYASAARARLEDLALDAAETELDEALRCWPECPAAWAEQGWLRALQGRPADADLALARAGTSARADYLRGRVHFERGSGCDEGELRAAREALERAAAAGPSAETWGWLGLTCLELFDLPAGQRACAAAQERDPNAATTLHLGLALMLAQARAPEAAALERAARHSRDPWLLRTLSEAYVVAGLQTTDAAQQRAWLEAARAAAAAGLRRLPDHPGLAWSAGRAARIVGEKRGSRDELLRAEGLLSGALARVPRLAGALAERGLCRLALGALSEAASDIRAARACSPRMAKDLAPTLIQVAARRAGAAIQGWSRDAGALETLDEAIAAEGLPPAMQAPLHVMRARLLGMSRRWPAARAAFELACRLDGGDPTARAQVRIAEAQTLLEQACHDPVAARPRLREVLDLALVETAPAAPRWRSLALALSAELRAEGGDLDRARREVAEARRIHDSLRARAVQATLTPEGARSDEALDAWRELQRANAADPYVRARLARLLVEAGLGRARPDLVEAGAAELEAGLERLPRHPALRKARAWLLALRADACAARDPAAARRAREAALADLDVTLAEEERDQLALRARGWLRVQLGRRAEGLADLEHALELSPEDPTLRELVEHARTLGR
ncbi:MAG: protein kinase [Planctomycetota bacterium]